MPETDTSSNPSQAQLASRLEVEASPALRRIGPIVHAVVVAHSPGDWFEETLESLRDQDHANLFVTVVDTSERADGEDARGSLAERVHSVLPGASVLEVEGNPGFASAANTALQLPLSLGSEEEPIYFLICHDDVSLATDAVTRLVEESARSGAGVVGPKIVDWEDTRVMQSMGFTVDKLGTPIPLMTPGEYDQGQRDEPVQALAVSSACMLVRCELFKALGGFDAAMSFYGEETDFGRRATIAGAAVRVAPSAVVRHRGKLAERGRGFVRSRMSWRHHLRSALVCAHPHEYELIPLALVMMTLEAVAALLSGHFQRVAALVLAWPWNLLGLPEVLRKRRELAQLRTEESLIESLRLRSRNVVSLKRFLRSLVSGTEENEGLLGRGSRYLAALRSESVRVAVVAWIVAGAVFVFGSRHLISRFVPAFGEFAQFGDSPGDLFAEWWSSWRLEGLGSDGSAPIALPLLGIASALSSPSLARTVLVLGLIPFGAVGLWRFLARFGSRLAQVTGLFVFLLMPLPYNALGNGNWGALGVYGLLPWILLWITRAVYEVPGNSKADFWTAWVIPALGVGALTGLLGAFVPLALAFVLMLATALAIGGLLVGKMRRVPRLLVATLVGSAIGWVLNWPYAPRSLQDLINFGGARPDAGDGYTLASLLRFDTGPVGLSDLVWGLVAIAAMGLFFARGGRFLWLVRSWCLVLLSLLWALANEHGWLVGDLPRAELLLAPGAVGLATAAALSVAAVDLDMKNFARKLLAGVAWLPILIGIVPVLGLSLDGRWGMPEGDYSTALAEAEEEAENSAIRILWVGHADVLPLAGWPLEDELVYATSISASPTVGSQWLTSPPGEAERLAEAWREAVYHGNNRLGERLALLGVRYLIVVERLAPEPFGEIVEPAPSLLRRRLGAQLDMELVETRFGITIYRNTNNAYRHAVVMGQGPLLEGDLTRDTLPMPLYEGRTTARGGFDDPARVFVADAAAGWNMHLDGEPAQAAAAFDWATVFNVDRRGVAELRYDSRSGNSVRAGQLALWSVVLAASVALAARRRRR